MKLVFNDGPQLTAAVRYEQATVAKLTSMLTLVTNCVAKRLPVTLNRSEFSNPVTRCTKTLRQTECHYIHSPHDVRKHTEVSNEKIPA